jgi:hypothetical protein
MGEVMSQREPNPEDRRGADGPTPDVTNAIPETRDMPDKGASHLSTAKSVLLSPGGGALDAPNAADVAPAIASITLFNPPGRKLPGWRSRLTAFLRDHHARPFVPGRWDCAIWTAGAVEAMTGVDHLRGFRGYRTIAEGQRRLQARGFDDHVAYVAALLPEVPPAFAQPGDVAVIAGASLGIVQGTQVYFFGVNGFGTRPFTIITRAFRT